MGSPSGRVPKQGPDWFLVATEACDGGTPDLGFFSPMFLGYMDLYRQKKSVGGASRGPGDRGTPRGVGAPPASCLPRCFLDVDSKSPGFLSFQKELLQKVSFRFDSV